MSVQFHLFELQEQDFLRYSMQLQDMSSTSKLGANALAAVAGK